MQFTDITEHFLRRLNDRTRPWLAIKYHGLTYYQIEIILNTLYRLILWSTYTQNKYTIQLHHCWDASPIQFYQVNLWGDFDVRRDQLIKKGMMLRPVHGMFYRTDESLLLFHNARKVITAGQLIVGIRQ